MERDEYQAATEVREAVYGVECEIEMCRKYLYGIDRSLRLMATMAVHMANFPDPLALEVLATFKSGKDPIEDMLRIYSPPNA